MAALQRDPLSVAWDAAAQTVLARAYAAKGAWVAVRIADPSARQAEAALALGINPLGPDNRSTRRKTGGVNARDRWRRAFVRAVHYHSGRPLEIQVGRKLPARGVIPAGRPVRIRVRRGGAAAMRAVARKDEADRIWTDEGERGGLFSDVKLRDW
jgi:hypothetical protein